MSTGCALDENWVNIVVKNSPLFLLGKVRRPRPNYVKCTISVWNDIGESLQQAIKLPSNLWYQTRRQAILQLHLNDQQFYCLWSCVLYNRFDGDLFGFFYIIYANIRNKHSLNYLAIFFDAPNKPGTVGTPVQRDQINKYGYISQSIYSTNRLDKWCQSVAAKHKRVVTSVPLALSLKYSTQAW